MAITVTGVPLGWLNVWEANIDLEGSTALRMSLHTSALAPNFNTLDFFDDASASQLAAANGYSRQTITNVALAHDATTDQIRLDFDNVAWTFSADQTWRYGVTAVDTGGADSTDPVLMVLDWGANQTTSGVFTIELDATGILAFDFGSL